MMVDSTPVQLGDMVINLDEDILEWNDTTGVYSIYGELNTHPTLNIPVLTLMYTVPIDYINEIVVSNTGEGLITSVIFGERYPAGTDLNGTILESEITNYSEYAGKNKATNDGTAYNNNDDIVITQMFDEKYYGLFITYEERDFNITVNADMTAHADTDGVLETDIMTVVFVHCNDAGVVDYAYTITLGDGDTVSLADIYNGTYDKQYDNTDYKGNTRSLTYDDFGSWTIYAYLPLFYENNTTDVNITNTIDTTHPTLSNIDRKIYNLSSNTVVDATAPSILPLSGINNSQIGVNCLGTFTLDTMVRDVTINITIHKALEHWLHASASNGYSNY